MTNRTLDDKLARPRRHLKIGAVASPMACEGDADRLLAPRAERAARLSKRERVVRSRQRRQAVDAAGIAAARVAVSRTGFGCEIATGTRTLRVDCAANIDADGSPKGNAAPRVTAGTAHVRRATIDRIGQCRWHPSARCGIEFITQECHQIRRATRAAMGTVFALAAHAHAPLRPPPADSSNQEARGSLAIGRNAVITCRWLFRPTRQPVSGAPNARTTCANDSVRCAARR